MSSCVISRTWIEGILSYITHGPQFSASQQINTITNGMCGVEQQTNHCIRFVERTNQPNWICTYAGTG